MKKTPCLSEQLQCCLFGVTIRIIVSVADWDIFIKPIWKQYYDIIHYLTGQLIYHYILCKKNFNLYSIIKLKEGYHRYIKWFSSCFNATIYPYQEEANVIVESFRNDWTLKSMCFFLDTKSYIWFFQTLDIIYGSHVLSWKWVLSEKEKTRKWLTEMMAARMAQKTVICIFWSISLITSINIQYE